MFLNLELPKPINKGQDGYNDSASDAKTPIIRSSIQNNIWLRALLMAYWRNENKEHLDCATKKMTCWLTGKGHLYIMWQWLTAIALRVREYNKKG